MKVYTIFDTVANKSGPLFEAENDGVASRNYKQLIQGNLFAHEFLLYCVGVYDYDTMVITPTNQPIHILVNMEVSNG